MPHRISNFLARLTLGLFFALTGLGAQAAERPDEGSLFGGSAESTPSPTSESTPAQPANNRDAKELEGNPSRDAFASGEVAENPIQIGGIYYQQLNGSFSQGANAGDTPLSSPLQFDGYLDGRPSDRLRAYLDARLILDPTKDAYSHAVGGGTSFSSLPTAAGLTPTALPNNPQVVLDQAWLKFDLERTLFVTAGKQHLKWGASHFWNPTDFLTPQRLDPLQPFDLRLGSSMLKVNAPWEAVHSSLYAVALFDDPTPASTLNQVGGAFRVESVIAGAEVGVDEVSRANMLPAYGADLSAPLGPLDIYAEAALLPGDHFSVPTLLASPTMGSDISTLLGSTNLPGPMLQASGGASYSFAWFVNRQATLTAEYFYNELGVEDAHVYPLLIYFGKYQPLYLAKHYAAAAWSTEGFDEEKKTSYNLSAIANLSDGSFVTRLDFNWLLLSYLTFGAYGDVHAGTQGGEFNFSLNTPALKFGTTSIPPVSFPSTVGDLGFWLRLAI
jgi:hypothetical protein